MQNKKSSQGVFAHSRPSPEKIGDSRSENRNCLGEIAGNCCAPETLLLVNQRISGEAKSDCRQQQGHSYQPIQLTGMTISAGEEDPEQMKDCGHDHKIR